ncbi:MAG: protein kinase [bacterium]
MSSLVNGTIIQSISSHGNALEEERHENEYVGTAFQTTGWRPLESGLDEVSSREAPKRGVQFRTWIVSGRSNRAYVAKLSDKTDNVSQEAGIYRLLKRKGVPNRYYPELVSCVANQHIRVSRNGREVGRLAGLIVKYYPYRNLSEYLASRPPRSERSKVADKLLRRMHTLNQLDIVHRDLHKKNVLVRKTEKGYIGVRIIDFGLSLRHADDEQLRNERKHVARLAQQIREGR